MSVDLKEETIGHLHELGEIPTAFLVERVLDVSPIEAGLGGIGLSEQTVEKPWIKDYDAIKDEGPSRWARQFDVINWGLIAVYRNESRVGAAVIGFDTPGVDMLEGRSDLAVLWDIRVSPQARSAGTGTKLFQAAEAWARSRGCSTLKAETQNINVPACRFYQRMGCTLRAIDRFAYPDLPGEVQLIWVKQL